MSTVTSNGMRELLIHDMRTPLATITGYAQLPEGDDEPQTERLDLVDLVRRVSADTNTVGRPRVVVLPSVPELVGEWNARAIEHLVANLLGNGLKYSLEEQAYW
jgi:signal transduction histidine kinase